MVALSKFKMQWVNDLLEAWFPWQNEQTEWMTVDRALSYAPVWNCVSKITGAFMVMPLNVHRYNEATKEKTVQTRHSSYQLWRWRPNVMQTPSQFKRTMLVHALLMGNARAYIRRSGNTPVELIPIRPDCAESYVVAGEKYHAVLIRRDDRLAQFVPVYLPNGQQGLLTDPANISLKEGYASLPDDEVWHLPGLGFDGIQGYSLITLAARSWNNGIGYETHVRKQQKRGYAGGLMIEAPPHMFRTEEEAKQFLQQFREQHTGADGEGIGMLREGMKANVLAMNNSDAQFLEQRRLNREDVALQFVLESILGDSSNASYNSLEQKNLAYRMNCLAPWTTAIEEECDIKLLTDSERNRGFYHKFNDGALLRTEKSATMSFISQGITSRVLSPNEGREMLDMNPYEGGDEYSNPAIDKVDNGSGGASNQPSDPTQERATQQRLAQLFQTEANRVKQAAERQPNFIGWVENFYQKNWQPKLADELEGLGVDRDLATLHCDESKSLILHALKDSTPETRLAAITDCVKTWKARAANLGELRNAQI